MRIWYVSCFLLFSASGQTSLENEVPQISEIDSLDILDIINTVLTDTSISWIGKKGHQVFIRRPSCYLRHQIFMKVTCHMLAAFFRKKILFALLANCG